MVMGKIVAILWLSLNNHINIMRSIMNMRDNLRGKKLEHSPATTAFLFPGQGSQTVGMGSELMAQSAEAKHVFEAVDSALDEKLSTLMAQGPVETLTLTQNAQPALFASSLAVLRTVEKLSGKSIAELSGFVAGHSLGEYSALCAAQSLELDHTARLLRLRGQSMQQAVPVGEGAMAALLGADIEQTEQFLEQAHALGIVQIANDNAPGQIVISGAVKAVHKAMEVAKEAGLRRIVELPVSAPFHCDLMAPAADVMATALADTVIQDAQTAVICNVTASAERQSAKLRQNLVAQVTGRVRWRETLMYLADNGVTRFVEIGTGKVLSGLVKRTVKDVDIFNLETMEDIENYLNNAS